MKALGIILLVLGLFMSISTGLSVINHKKVVDVGPIEVTKEERTPIYWSPWTGIVLIAAGTIILVSAGKKKIA